MGYLHINNLYQERAQTVLMFKECYALEKVHGTSAHIAWKDGKVAFFSGGAKHEAFVALFDGADLTARFLAIGNAECTVYGEAYGGKMQGMSATYGKELRFIVFDVKVGKAWLSVPNAKDVADKLGLEFVPFWQTPASVDQLNMLRDRNSQVAINRGCGDKIMEGIVIRPLREMFTSDGERVIAKHKRPEFSERKTIPEVDPTKREMMEKAEEIAAEWVTDMRLSHVLDKLGNPTEMSSVPQVIAAMVEDVCREADDEIKDSKAARKAIGTRACKLFKASLVARISQ